MKDLNEALIEDLNERGNKLVYLIFTIFMILLIFYIFWLIFFPELHPFINSVTVPHT